MFFTKPGACVQNIVFPPSIIEPVLSSELLYLAAVRSIDILVDSLLRGVQELKAPRVSIRFFAKLGMCVCADYPFPLAYATQLSYGSSRLSP